VDDYGSEFPFVDLNLHTYYAQNLAAGANVTVTINGNKVTNWNGYDTESALPSELVDNDYCCSPFVPNNDGYKCGIHFHSNDTAEIIISLPAVARVDEIDTSWYDPCDYMPAQYSVSASWCYT
jgi:hypothetical protein